MPNNVIQFPHAPRALSGKKRTLEDLANPEFVDCVSLAATLLYHSHVESISDAIAMRKQLKREFNNIPPGDDAA